MKNIIIFGPPGSGKGTQSKMLSKNNKNFFHISIGDILRKYSSYNERIKNILDSGQLMPDIDIISIIKKKLFNIRYNKMLYSGNFDATYIYDGFPRTVNQSKFLSYNNNKFFKVKKILHISVDVNYLIERLSGRMIHIKSGRVYHVKNNPPKYKNKDDITGELLVQRKDDNEIIIKKRFDIYHRDIKEMIDTLINNIKNIDYYKIDGCQSIEKIYADIMNVIK